MTRAAAAIDPELADSCQIRLDRIVAAPPETVWRCWAEPGNIERWWGPEGFTTTTHSRDFSAGGTWRFTMHGPDGRDYGNRIRFTAFDPLRRIAWEHAGDGDTGDIVFSSVATFEPVDSGTRVTLALTFPSRALRDRVVAEFGALEGGRQTLARLDRLAMALDRRTD